MPSYNYLNIYQMNRLLIIKKKIWGKQNVLFYFVCMRCILEDAFDIFILGILVKLIIY
jgi:hypothetical protein